MENKKIHSFLLVLFSLLLVLFSKLPVNAAELYLQILNSKFQIPSVGVGQQFQVDLMLDTEGEIINAIEGEIAFPKELLEIREIKDGDSIINLWVERPHLGQEARDKQQGKIGFSGIIPTGFAGVLSPDYKGERPGKIFSLIFRAKGEGEGIVNLENGKVLLHDGLGTPAKLRILNFEFRILKHEVQISDSKFQIPEDKELPEKFKPEIASDPSLFDGKYFLVFATQDKGSGIDHYKVCEGTRKCVIAESPYLLQNQDLDEAIVVKAVDKSGNERVATIPAQKPRAWYKDYAIIAILIIAGIVFTYFIWKFLWKKRRK